MGRRETLTPDEARRAVLAAQGLARPRAGAGATPGTRALVQTLRRLGVVQIDSVNVVSRAHYLPFFSRLGTYDRALLDAAGDRAPRRTTEYWAHEASIIPVASLPLFRWRMAQDHPWGSVSESAHRDPALTADVLAAFAAHGPLTVARLESVLEHDAARPSGLWGWNWSVVKQIVEHLFWTGEVAAAGRDAQFRRRYALPHQVLPASVLATPAPARGDAVRELVDIAARALGVSTADDLRDWFRLPAADTDVAIDELAEAGHICPVAVSGWPAAWRHRDLVVPRSIDNETLLAPFDPLIWHRPRVQRLFGMRYRIEIYVPAGKREFGYYVLPFLCGDRLRARVDLKVDRRAGELIVQSAWSHNATSDTPDRLATALRRLADWSGVPRIVVRPRGDLATRLTGAVGAGS